MQAIKLQNNLASNVTVLSNDFIDRYMVDANGEFVKIYLYILRLTMDPSLSCTLSDITDRLECTSKDIMRALKYWSQKGLICCGCDDRKEIVSITFTDPASVSAADPVSESSASNITPFKAVHIDEDTDIAGTDIDAEPEMGVPAVSIMPERSTALAPGRIRSLRANSEVKQLLFVAEQYLGHKLNSTEIETILYFYEELHFSADLLEYLIEYCVSRGCKSIHYIRKVAFAWADSGITTVKEAKQSNKLYNKNCYAIMNAYGLGNRNPGTAELEYIHTWLSEYPFTSDIILEAVNRTMKQIHTPQFSYTDGILRKWLAAGVKTASDIEVLDQEHSAAGAAEAAASSRAGRGAVKRTSASVNAFNNFSGREYDYNDLEKRLLDSK